MAESDQPGPRQITLTGEHLNRLLSVMMDEMKMDGPTRVMALLQLLADHTTSGIVQFEAALQMYINSIMQTMVDVAEGKITVYHEAMGPKDKSKVM